MDRITNRSTGEHLTGRIDYVSDREIRILIRGTRIRQLFQIDEWVAEKDVDDAVTPESTLIHGQMLTVPPTYACGASSGTGSIFEPAVTCWMCREAKPLSSPLTPESETRGD